MSTAPDAAPGVLPGAGPDADPGPAPSPSPVPSLSPSPPVPSPPGSTTYRVAYALAGLPGVRHADVAVVPGHSQESDLPRILAARLTGRPADAAGITLLDVRESPDDPPCPAATRRRATGRRPPAAAPGSGPR